MTLQIELTKTQSAALERLAAETGKSHQALVTEMIDRLIDEADQVDWRGALARLEGIWADRDDLPDFQEIRREMDRDLWAR